MKAHFDLHSNSSSLNPYVEVKIGNYKGITKPYEEKQNPEWNVVFAFARHNLRSFVMDVVVKEKDILVKHDFVGSVKIPIHETPVIRRRRKGNWSLLCGMERKLIRPFQMPGILIQFFLLLMYL